MLKKNFHLCFSRIKCLPTSFSQPLTLEEEEDEEEEFATQGMMKSFNSLYDVVSTSKSTSTTTTTSAATAISSDDYSVNSGPQEPDLSTVLASQRFFIASPGPTNSILDSSSTVVGGGVAVRKDSPDPYMDFRRSMEEMVLARRQEHHRTAENQGSSSGIVMYDDWEYLHELLLCYLSLNPKHAHKFIIGAFADVLVSLMTATGGGDTVVPTRRIHGGDGG